MGKHKLEEYFRDRLSQHEETLDKNELWESLGLEPEPQRRKPFWMYWLVGSGLSLLIGFAIFSYVSIQDSTSVVPEKNLSDAKVEMQNRSIEERASAANNMEVTQAEPTPLRSLSDPDSNAENSQSAISEKGEATNIVDEIPKRILDKKSSPAIIKNPLAASTKTRTLEESEKSIAPDKLIVPAADSQKQLRSTVTQKTVSTAVNETEKPRPMISDIGIFYGIEPTALLIKKREIDFGKSEVLSPLVSGGSGTPFSMGAYGGIYKTYRTLSDLGETGYVKSRDSLETVLETFTTGAYLRMDVTEHTYVKLGMEYQSIAERLQYAFIADSTITENVVEFNATVLKEWRNYNHHRLVNVPLTIGYEINLGQWHLVAEGTSVVSVRKSFSGLMLDRGGELSSGVDQFSTGMSFAGRLALGIGYELENLSFHCLPTFQKHFGSFSEITTGYDQEYQMLGIQLGVNYHFKR